MSLMFSSRRKAKDPSQKVLKILTTGLELDHDGPELKVGRLPRSRFPISWLGTDPDVCRNCSSSEQSGARSRAR